MLPACEQRKIHVKIHTVFHTHLVGIFSSSVCVLHSLPGTACSTAAKQGTTASQPRTRTNHRNTSIQLSTARDTTAKPSNTTSQPASTSHSSTPTKHSNRASQPAQLAAQQKRNSYATRQHMQEKTATQPGRQHSSKYTPGKGTQIRYPTSTIMLTAELKQRHLAPKHQTHAGVEL